MRFAQAQPPPLLRILRRAPQELSQERGELFDGALESLPRKKREQYGIAFYPGVKCRREFAACRRPADGLIHASGPVRVVHDLYPLSDSPFDLYSFSSMPAA